MILYLCVALLLLLLAAMPLLGAGDVRYQWATASCLTLIAYALSFLRWETGTDWPSYIAMFDGLTNIEAVHEQSWWGPGYSYPAVLVNACGGSYTVLLFCIATVLFSAKFHMLRQTCAAPLIAIYVLFCTSFYDIYFVRQSIAVIFFWAFAYYWFNRKPVYALCAAALTVAFHTSALLPIALILPIGKVRPRTALLCGVPALLFVAFAISRLSITDLISLPFVKEYVVSSFVEVKETELSTTFRAYLKISFWVFLIAAGYYSFYKRILPSTSKEWNAYCLHCSAVIVAVSAAILPVSEVFARYPAYAAPFLASVLANYRFPAAPLTVGGAAYLTVLLLMFVELGFQYSAYPDLFYPIRTVFD
jgi:hypothetical protein